MYMFRTHPRAPRLHPVSQHPSRPLHTSHLKCGRSRHGAPGRSTAPSFTCPHISFLRGLNASQTLSAVATAAVATAPSLLACLFSHSVPLIKYHLPFFGGKCHLSLSCKMYQTMPLVFPWRTSEGQSPRAASSVGATCISTGSTVCLCDPRCIRISGAR